MAEVKFSKTAKSPATKQLNYALERKYALPPGAYAEIVSALKEVPNLDGDDDVGSSQSTFA